jgi:hypothetical protein
MVLVWCSKAGTASPGTVVVNPMTAHAAKPVVRSLRRPRGGPVARGQDRRCSDKVDEERSATYMTHVVLLRAKTAHAVGAVRQVVVKRVVLFRPGKRRQVNGVKGRCVDMLLSAADAVMS